MNGLKYRNTFYNREMLVSSQRCDGNIMAAYRDIYQVVKLEQNQCGDPSVTTLPHFLSHYAIYYDAHVTVFTLCHWLIRLKVITGFRLNHLYVVFPNQWVLARDLHLKKMPPPKSTTGVPPNQAITLHRWKLQGWIQDSRGSVGEGGILA